MLQEFITKPDAVADPNAVNAKELTLPGQGEIMDMMPVADPDVVHAVRTFIKALAFQLKDDLAAVSDISQPLKLV